MRPHGSRSNAAIRPAEQPIIRHAWRDRRDILGRQVLQVGQCIGAAHLDLTHMADIEQPGSRAHRLVLIDDAAVLHRHLPTTELNHACASREVIGVERRAP